MKNILKITIFAFLLITLGSCTNDKSPVTTANGFKLRDVSTVTPPAVLLQTNSADVYDNLEWDRADYGVPTQAKYTIVVSDHDSDPTFQHYIEYNGAGIDPEGDARKATLTVGEFNDLLNQLPTHNCGIMNIDIRIKSVLGNGSNSQIQYSNPITTSVTSYSTALPILTFVKDAANPALAAKLVASTPTTFSDYEGYMYLEAGSYKFYRPDACGDFSSPTIYGGTGGTLVQGSSSTSITIAVAGHYFVTADLTATGMTYSVKLYRAFGVFGPAKAVFGFNNISPMTDDANNNIWKITGISLIKGKKFRFKSNDWPGTPTTVPSTATVISILGSTTIPYSLISYPTTSTTGGEITVPGDFNNNATQKYDIVLDVSNPRNYTYTMTLNPN